MIVQHHHRRRRHLSSSSSSPLVWLYSVVLFQGLLVLLLLLLQEQQFCLWGQHQHQQQQQHSPHYYYSNGGVVGTAVIVSAFSIAAPPLPSRRRGRRRSTTPTSIYGLFQINDNNDRTTVKDGTTSSSIQERELTVGKNIGSGSYGTVHLLIDSAPTTATTTSTATTDESSIRTANTENVSPTTTSPPSSSLSVPSTFFVGKRPWTEDEFRTKQTSTPTVSTKANDNTEGTKRNVENGANNANERERVSPNERAQRCWYYWQVEKHCFNKLPPHPQLPPFWGCYKGEWMVFGFVGTTTTVIVQPPTLSSGKNNDDDDDSDSDDGNDECKDKSATTAGQHGGQCTTTIPIPAPTLRDLMDLDDIDDPQQLKNLGTALGTTSFGDTLDTVIPSILTILQHIHQYQIVHRDVKPSNLLVHNGTVLLLDFGSAADLEPSVSDITSGNGNGGFGALLQTKQRVGLDDTNSNNGLFGGGTSRAAVSPIYAAPEIFITVQNAPTAFDIFSTALIICQLLFGYLEDRIDAGFHQQLGENGANWDINIWLHDELGTKLRPAGLDHALEYLVDRPGLWKLLDDMLSIQPTDRPTAQDALERWNGIMKRKDKILNDDDVVNDDDTDVKYSRAEVDGPFFAMVLEALETCEIPSISRPLHFVTTFSRSQSLGLVLSEKDDKTEQRDDDDKGDDATVVGIDSTAKGNNRFQVWREATKDTVAGEVFVKDVVPGSQAEQLGVIEVGDRLSGIGELPFIDGGFERAVEMLQDQPRAAKFVRLHFDRMSVRANDAISIVPTQNVAIAIADYGAWSSKGRRKAQEDAFVLHEIHDAKDRSVLVAGVMDGHGGTAASTMVAQEFPGLLANQLVVQSRQRSVTDAMEDSWKTICTSYQQQCAENGDSCIADYDSRQGVLMAETGSQDLTAGTTCSTMALDETTSQLSILNCGDSRSVVVTSDGQVRFATTDHKPQTEEERLMEGISRGLDYSLPQCRLSRWWLKVGDYEYSVGRSLEGPFATSKGIVSDPDVTTLTAERGEILISASDGLWDVMDSSEVALDLHKMRHREKMSARDTARTLCSMALRKGTSDNVSAVVVFL
jgi:serine/threonine protein phosphatase PrpC/serine/threonine protein kinase